MFILTLVFYFQPTPDYVPRASDYRRYAIVERDEATCRREMNWWLENYERRPPGLSADWRRLTGPLCAPRDPKGDPRNPVPAV